MVSSMRQHSWRFIGSRRIIPQCYNSRDGTVLVKKGQPGSERFFVLKIISNFKLSQISPNRGGFCAFFGGAFSFAGRCQIDGTFSSENRPYFFLISAFSR
jgi:hypothetical protein